MNIILMTSSSNSNTIIKPFIEFLCGSKMKLPKCIKAKVNFSMKKKTKRMEWVRVVLDSNKLRNYPVNVNKYGNTTAGTIPIALDEAVEKGHLDEGDLLLLAAFGGGFTWGSMLIRWGNR